MLSKKAMQRILQEAGAKRVSPLAAEKLANILYEKGLEIAKEAVKNAQFDGRNTIRKEDLTKKEN